MKTKILILVCLLLLTCLQLIGAEKLNMFIEVKRYLDASKNTRYVIDYQVPYKNLMFMTRDSGFYAELKVGISIAYPDSENFIAVKEFTNNIGVSQKYDVTSSNKSYLDRISLTLAKPGYRLKLAFSDLNSNKEFEWLYLAEPLDESDNISDLDLITKIIPDTTVFSQKFTIRGVSALPEVSGILTKGYMDSVFVSCETYLSELGVTPKATLVLTTDSTTVMIDQRDINPQNQSGRLWFPISVSNLEPGQYNVLVKLEIGKTIQSRSLSFFLTEQVEDLNFVFMDVDEEYQLISSLTSAKTMSSWKTMSIEAKRRYISNSWSYLAASQNQSVESVLTEYKKRIDYCNLRFSHFSKGWKSDMGRIYIRNGAPDDIDADTSSDLGKLGRKDFQIWKYSGNPHAVYLFIDIPMNGNYKLMYTDNDEQESTNPNWRKYLGSDFDEARLEN